MKYMAKYVLSIVLLTLSVAGLSQVMASDSQSDSKPKPSNRWQPPESDGSAYRDIIDFNIFRSDRKKLADLADRDRNPKPTESSKPEPVEVVEKTPPNPDSLLRLTGIAHTPKGVVAFVEHATSGELSRLTGPERFGQGEVTEIGLRSVLYVVADERREINVGETFLGERLVPVDASPTGASDSSRSSTSNLSPAERLRLLREKRARELGTAPPTQTPAAEEPQESSDTSQKNTQSRPNSDVSPTSTEDTSNETKPIPAGSDADANNS